MTNPTNPAQERTVKESLHKTARRIAATPTKSTLHMSESERQSGVLQMLADLDELAKRDGCVAAAWALEYLQERPTVSSESEHTPGPWEYVSGEEFHGPYITSDFGDICDFYVMSKPEEASILNRGPSKPVLMQGSQAEANARLGAAAPDLLAACEVAAQWLDGWCPNQKCCANSGLKIHEQILKAINKAKGT